MIKPIQKQKKNKVGAVLVIGGGIAGIQTSLDLAESGQKVYLLERSPAIGGNMARLDKTFPTNDCSMCILSPKIVECGRHRNIELLTLSDFESIEGEPGSFKIKLRHRARYVDPSKCTGCGSCLENCPTQNLLRLDGDNVKLDLKPEYINLVDYLLKEHGASQKSVMRILQEINTQLRFLPETALLYLSEKLDIPISTLYRIGSFYKAFSFKPRGKYIISVCSGTACHVRGSSSIVDEIEKILKIKNGETTEDGKFTLETVNCVGACALGPVIVINGNYHGHLTRDKIEPILKEYV